MALENGNVEIFFAKKLANNDKKVREKALKKLKTWLTNKEKSKSGLTEEELLKIWKGLFYCMWFSDKPLVQEELAENLAATVQLFKPTSTGILFSKVFFVTMGREWLGIDKLRLDKFYLLVRKFITGLLQYLCDLEWNESIVTEYSQFLEDILSNQKYPDGMKLFVAEHILQILTDVCSTSKTFPSDEIFVLLIKPFFTALVHPQSFTVHRIIENEIMKSLLKMEIKNNADKVYGIPFESLADILCEYSARKSIKTKTRKLLFSYTESYRQHAKELKLPKQKTKKHKKPNRKSKKDKEQEETDEEHATANKKRKVAHMNGLSSVGEQKPTVTENGTLEEEEEEEEEEAPTKIEEVINGDSKRAKAKGKIKRNRTIKKKRDRIITSQEVINIGNGEDIITHLSSEVKESTEKMEDSVRQTLKFTDSSSSEKDDSRVDSKKVVDKKRRKTLPSKTEDSNPLESLIKKRKTRRSFPNELSVSSQSKGSTQEEVNGDQEGSIINLVNSEPLVKVNENKKKKRKTLIEEDVPKPVVEFLKTPPPKAFARRQAAAKTEPKKAKELRNKKKLSPVTPKTEPRIKSVKIDTSKNEAICFKELKVSPMPVFNPDKRPLKGLLKSTKRAATTRRSKATDFF